MPVGVTRCGRDLRYVWASQAYPNWMQQPLTEIVDRPISEVLGRYEQIMRLKTKRRATSKKRAPFLERVPHADQRRRLGVQSAVIQSNQNIAGEYKLREVGEWPNLHSHGRVRNVVRLVRCVCETRQS